MNIKLLFISGSEFGSKYKVFDVLSNIQFEAKNNNKYVKLILLCLVCLNIRKYTRKKETKLTHMLHISKQNLCLIFFGVLKCIFRFRCLR